MELCRLCYSEISLHLYRTVFNSTNEPPFLDIIRKLTNINISENDCYSKVMCLNCYNKLMGVHDFLQVILETDSKFRQQFNNNSEDANDVNQNVVQSLEIKQEHCDVDDDDNYDQSEADRAVVETTTSICEKIEDFHVAATVKEEIHDDEYGNHQEEMEETPEVSSFSESKTTVNTTETFDCNVCNATFPYQLELIEHSKLHNSIDAHKCNICQKEFAIKRSLTRHMKTHIEEEPSKCDICDRVFTRKNSLLKHMKVHSDDKLYTCDTCDEVFTQFLEFREHKQIHCDKLYVCNVCGKRFITRGHSMRHVKIHFGQKSHECNVCGEKFTQKSSLLRHFRLHSSEIETDKKESVNTQLQLSSNEK